tara:strand:- start:103 stop:405 length:303 start_codon:yes stop_codon:yes gene_type:complete
LDPRLGIYNKQTIAHSWDLIHIDFIISERKDASCDHLCELVKCLQISSFKFSWVATFREIGDQLSTQNSDHLVIMADRDTHDTRPAVGWLNWYFAIYDFS